MAISQLNWITHKPVDATTSSSEERENTRERYRRSSKRNENPPEQPKDKESSSNLTETWAESYCQFVDTLKLLEMLSRKPKAYANLQKSFRFLRPSKNRRVSQSKNISTTKK